MNGYTIMKRATPWIIAALLTLSWGCVDDIIRQFIPVAPTDGDVPLGDGGASATDSDGSAIDQLSVSSAHPDHGPFVGGTDVILSGSGFGDGMTVTIGGRAVREMDLVVLSPMAIRILTPAGEVGPADIVVSRGQQEEHLPEGFLYDPVHLDPDSGPMTGGTMVKIQGIDTDFSDGMTLTLGGQPMTDVEVISSTLLRAKTPKGQSGPADLVFGEPSQERTVEGAFTYYQSTNPKSGGLGGGPINGTLTVSVLNWFNRAPVAGATVVVQKERELVLTGTTNSSGMVAFSHKELLGPVTVTAAKKKHETSSIVSFDARDATLFLTPIVQPQPGPFPPGLQPGTVKGFVLFGGTTGAGSPVWKMIPEPKTGQQKRVYVYTTVPNMNWGPSTPGSNATIDYAADGSTAWPYSITGRTGAMAVYAVAGLYTADTEVFLPYAMGVTRGVVVGPGEVARADVWINIPLINKVKIQIQDAPPEVDIHTVNLAVDLGAEGLLMTEDWLTTGDGVPETVTFSRIPPFNHKGLLDATFTVDVILENNNTSGLPLVRAIERSVQPDHGTLLVDRFVGVPVQLKPTPDGFLQGNTFAWTQKGSPYNLAYSVIESTDGVPLWRIVHSGSVSRAQLPDPQTFGLPPWPKGPTLWLHWLAHLPDFDFNTFTYNHLSSRYWDRWSFDLMSFKVP